MGKTDRKKNLQSQTNIVGILPLNAVFSFFPIFSPSQCCLSQFTHQILATSIGRARRQKVSQQFWLENNGTNFYQI